MYYFRWGGVFVLIFAGIWPLLIVATFFTIGTNGIPTIINFFDPLVAFSWGVFLFLTGAFIGFIKAYGK